MVLTNNMMALISRTLKRSVQYKICICSTCENEQGNVGPKERNLFTCNGGSALASWLVRSPPDRGVQI